MMAQWIRIRLPMQETRVQSLIWEDSHMPQNNYAMCHNYQACAPEHGNNY